MTSKYRAVALVLLVALSLPSMTFTGGIGSSDHGGVVAADHAEDTEYILYSTGNDEYLRSTDAVTESQLWAVRPDPGDNTYGVAADPNRDEVYVYDQSRTLTSRNTHDGGQEWSESLSGTGGPTLYDETNDQILVGTSDPTVYAVDHGGGVNWQFTSHTFATNGLALDSKSEYVYVADNDGNLYQVDATDGSQGWSSSGSTRFGAGNTLDITEDGRLFAALDNGNIAEYDTADGSQINSFSVGTELSSIAIDDENLVAYVGDSTDNNIRKVDISDESVLWSQSTSGTPTDLDAPVDFSEVFIGSDNGDIESFSPDGNLQFSKNVHGTDAVNRIHVTGGGGEPISGQIVDEDGDPIEDATLTNLNTGDEETSDAAGEYELLVDDPGEYDIEADAVGYEATVETVDVPEGGTTKNFTLELTDGPFLKEHRPSDGDARDSSGVLLEARIGHHDNDPTSVEFYLRDPDNSTFRKVGEGSGSDGDVVRVSLSDTAGKNEWFVELTDGPNTHKSDVFTFRSPGWLDVVDAETEAAIDDRTISAEVTRIAAGLHETEETSTTDGRIEFDGVVAPSTGQWAIELTTDGYEQKTVVYPDLEKGHTTDLIRDDLDWSARYDQTFAIDDQSGSYPPSETVVEAERLIDGSWERVESQLAGSDNRATLELLDEKEYRLKVRNAEGESRVVQQFTGDSNVSDEVVTLSIQSLEQEQEFQQGSWSENDDIDEWVSESDYNARPMADFSFSPSDPITGESVSFDASSSTDMDGSIDSYEWDFGSGFTDSGETATHTFDEVGTTQVTLRVTDDGGLTDRQTRYLYVAEDEESRSNPPTAVIEKRTEDPNVGDLVTFDASGSIGDGVEIVSHKWDLNADGSFDESGETIEASFDEPGFHRVTLQVTDENGATGTEWLSFVVYADEPPGGSSGGSGGSFGPTGEEQSTNPYIVGGVLLIGALFVWRRFFGGSVPDEVRQLRR